MPNSRTNYDLFVKRWAWLFPAVYIFHILEEYYGGFYVWLARVAGGTPPLQFPKWDALFLAVMIAGIAVVMLKPSWRWLALIFALASALNGLTHLLVGIVTMSYSPGVISGAVFWLPLGGYILYLAYKDLRRKPFILGIVGGVVLHLTVCFLVLSAVR